MRNILSIAFFLSVLLSFGIPSTGQDHKSCTDIYSLVSETPEFMENGDIQSDYVEGIDLTSLTSSLLPGGMNVTDTQRQFFYDKIFNIFQPPR